MGNDGKGPPMHSLERDIAAWLHTLVATEDATQRDPARASIVPPARPSTGGNRALALLNQLARMPPGDSAQLRTGATIGQGGMGVIRLAEQVALGRTVAVKTLRPDRRGREATLDLLREAWVTGSLEHPNVVPVYYIGLDEDGSPLIVLKRIEGVEWSELIADPEAVADRFGATDLLEWNLGILMQVLNAVRFAHSRGIVHRDIKPSNVMIGQFGEVYLLDWGIAVSLRDDASGRLPQASDATEMAGTPCYMAPEMLGGERGIPLSERTDVYLAGAVLYEIIAGTPPHDGDTALAIITSVATSRPEIPAAAPTELARVCLRAMDPDPAARFADAESMRLAVQHYLQHRGSSRLADQARERLDELDAALAAPDGDPRKDREEIYKLFGACRFGFHEALAMWRDNEEARAGLRHAIIAVAEHELAIDDPRAAVGLLSELEDPPAELVARARAAAAARAQRRAELEQLGQQYDHTIGTRTRTFLMLVLGACFTGFPLFAGLTGVQLRTHGQHIVWSCGFLLIVIALGFWARDSLSKTVINRRIAAAMVFLFVAQVILQVGMTLLEVPIAQSQVMMLFLWLVMDAMLAIGVDRRLAPSVVGFLIAFLVAARFPEHRFFAMSAANFGFTVNAVWLWRPRSLLRYTEAEQRARQRADDGRRA
ncbi:MAG TPA: serine/threonine-protein kinase [Kofleriaceae bacterium]|nr:serine/threonine-protein kinase [Kofleriaceae bacterium]